LITIVSGIEDTLLGDVGLFANISNNGKIADRVDINGTSDLKLMFELMIRQEEIPDRNKQLYHNGEFFYETYDEAAYGGLNYLNAYNSSVQFFNAMTRVDPDTNGFGQYNLVIGKNGAFSMFLQSGAIAKAGDTDLIGKMWGEMPAAEQAEFIERLNSGELDQLLAGLSRQDWLADLSNANASQLGAILGGLELPNDLVTAITNLEYLDGTTLAGVIQNLCGFTGQDPADLGFDLAAISQLTDPTALVSVRNGIVEFVRAVLRNFIVSGVHGVPNIPDQDGVIDELKKNFIPYSLYTLIFPDAATRFYNDLTNYVEWDSSGKEQGEDGYAPDRADRYINWFIKMPGEGASTEYTAITITFRMFDVLPPELS
jgi:hypothetical protein